MRRLTSVIVSTRRFTEMQSYYADRVGLSTIGTPSDHWLEFDAGGASLALLRMDDEGAQGMALRFHSDDLAADVAVLSARGVAFEGPIRDFGAGRFAEFRDPEDNLVGLLQPHEEATERRHVVDRVVLSCKDFAATVHYYREKVGLRPTVESDHWVEFDTGTSRLALHPRRRDVDHPPHTDQNITVVFQSDDLMDWVEAMRSREVHFATAPIEEDFGLYAEAADPDGYMVVFREPPPPLSIEEELAEAFEEEDAPHQVAIRKPAQKPSRAGGLIAGRRKRARREAAESSTATASRPVPEASKKLDVVAPRGTGEAGARRKPKRIHDPKRAKAKPSIGSLREAERNTIKQKKRSVARASKGKPVKAAVKRAAPKRAVPKRAAPKRAAPKRAAPKRAAPKRAAPKKATRPTRPTRSAAKPKRAAAKRAPTRGKGKR